MQFGHSREDSQRDVVEVPRVIWALYNDPHLMQVGGRTLISAESADADGITDNPDVQDEQGEQTL